MWYESQIYVEFRMSFEKENDRIEILEQVANNFARTYSPCERFERSKHSK